MATPVSTIADFVAVVRKSGLVADARLDEACAAWPDHGQPLPEALTRQLVAAGLLTPWQIDQLRKGKHKGFTLGNYKLLALLGAGGMSSVYLAEHMHLHVKVAIKVLPVKKVEKTSYLARFEQEAREAFRLRDHPNIVRATDSGTAGAIHYFVMDYVEGIDLHAKVKRDGPLPHREAADYVRQAALGLQYAHDQGVVHRDIKPANLVLDARGVVKILDFGLALADAGDDDGSLTQEYDERILGTADYLAPEQAIDSHKADARSDIYSLGCTLYYLLVGRVPFPGGKLADRILAHQKKERPNPLDDQPGVAPEVVALYFRMMERHPDARPQSAREVAEALKKFLDTPAPAAPAAPAGTAPPSPPRRADGAAARAGGSGVWPAVPRPPASGIGRRSGSSGIIRGTPVFAPAAGSVPGRAAGKPAATPGSQGPEPAGAASAARRWAWGATLRDRRLWVTAVLALVLVGAAVAFWSLRG